VDLQQRIQTCKDRLSELNTKFDRAVGVETRMLVKEMRSEGITKRKHSLSASNFSSIHPNLGVE
jgi:hypothetical protein